MAEVFHLPPPLPAVVLSMTPNELREEWRAHEDALISAEADLLRIAEAVWPEGQSEMPCDMEHVSARHIVAGIASLHELLDRMYAENERLRAAAAGVELREEDRHA